MRRALKHRSDELLSRNEQQREWAVVLTKSFHVRNTDKIQATMPKNSFNSCSKLLWKVPNGKIRLTVSKNPRKVHILHILSLKLTELQTQPCQPHSEPWRWVTWLHKSSVKIPNLWAVFFFKNVYILYIFCEGLQWWKQTGKYLKFMPEKWK